MSGKTNQDSGSVLPESDRSRRQFLSIIPIGIFGAIAVSLGAASHKFLSPAIATAKAAGELAVEKWKSLGLLSELSGTEPIEKLLTIERHEGWRKSVEETTVFVLPQHENKVLSCVCPHEGCPIVWDADSKNFLCPCHESFFTDGGKRISGPSDKDLIELETRVEDGKLQVKI